MIIKIDTIDIIKPVFKQYLTIMNAFFDIHDFDKWSATALNNLKSYIRNTDRNIYAIKEAGHLIGFIFINKHLRFNSDGFAVAEFFIQNNHTKKGYGRYLAEFAFNRFPGHWEIAVTQKNTVAARFWKQVVSSYTQNRFSIEEKPSFNGKGFVFNNSDQQRS
ncbi:MAG: GNAT family N-acetyltransferase [Pseudomonadota bacterium]